MDILEKFNSKFGGWYEGLFGAGGGELRPKDVLRKILAAMEDGRKEGLDGKIYVPNKYTVELAVDDPEEREYLLSFLDEDELAATLKKFMAQHGYKTRGPLDFTIAEVPEEERAERRDTLRVRGRYEKGDTAPPAPNSGATAPDGGAREDDDLPTVAGLPAASDEDDEPGTVPAVAWATLTVTGPDGQPRRVSLTRPTFQMGRSRTVGNDLVLDADDQISKAHARLERERDGSWTLYDLASTNGVRVGGARVDGNRVLQNGDILTLGSTALAFEQTPPRADSPTGAGPVSAGGVSRALDALEARLAAPPRRARLVGQEGDAHVLASETLIGRAVTSDIVLPGPSVSTKHARIISPDATTYLLEDLGGPGGTRVNGRTLPPGRRQPLTNGDVLHFGDAEMRFESERHFEAAP